MVHVTSRSTQLMYCLHTRPTYLPIQPLSRLFVHFWRLVQSLFPGRCRSMVVYSRWSSYISTCLWTSWFFNLGLGAMSYVPEFTTFHLITCSVPFTQQPLWVNFGACLGFKIWTRSPPYLCRLLEMTYQFGRPSHQQRTSTATHDTARSGIEFLNGTPANGFIAPSTRACSDAS